MKKTVYMGEKGKNQGIKDTTELFLPTTYYQ